MTDCGSQFDAIPSRKRALYAINKKLGIIGLGKNRTFLAKVRCFLGLVRHRSRQNHLGARSVFSDPAGQSKPVQFSRRLGVGEDDIDHHRTCVHDQDRFVCVPGLHNFEPAFAQIFSDWLTNKNIRLNHKNTRTIGHSPDPWHSFRVLFCQRGADASDDISRIVGLGNKRPDEHSFLC